jgi:hypothetical protein
MEPKACRSRREALSPATRTSSATFRLRRKPAHARSATSLLSAWSNFYVITGSSAAALTGLMFVVITLGAGGRSQTSHEGIATFSTPTVVHFGAALLISALLSVPWHSLAHAAVVLGAAGLYGVAYTARSLLLAAGKGKMLAPGDPGRSSSTRAAGDGNVGPVLFPDRPCPGASCLLFGE